MSIGLAIDRRRSLVGMRIGLVSGDGNAGGASNNDKYRVEGERERE